MTADGGAVQRKVCPSCGTAFDCVAGGCWCDDVPLIDSTRAALRAKYTDCLCPAYLRAVSEHSDLLMIQFLVRVADVPRTYADVMEAWRSSCPRQSVWEDAQIDGLVAAGCENVMLTPRGQAVLDAANVRSAPVPPSNLS